ncbi:unnamed protein product [Ilex paraguariensis]|uniref:protein-serine/threonine phosphatase n=1 Tax=Ilex paraguariensis TaxID=185542 RepID=A0ABC8RB13_9AQUA
MAEICCGMVSEKDASPPCESGSRSSRRRRMEIRRIKFVADIAMPENESGEKRPKLELYTSRECDNAVENCDPDGEQIRTERENGRSETKEIVVWNPPTVLVDPEAYPKYGVASVCGRRRDMEDAVAIHPSFCRREHENTTESHYFGVYDGHGCSHVAMKCRDRLHELVKEEVENKVESADWERVMVRSFYRMDKEVIAWDDGVLVANCRCELQTPDCDAVGSTAVVSILTPNKIIVANCGDSRAVLCRNGKPIPLSTDHKPDRPDELSRIQEAGGRVIYWEGARVLGVLAMSRAIGDYYLKPYVSCEPEVTITDRTADDDCLILASDGLWDVVSNETACGVAKMCLKGKAQAVSTSSSSSSSQPGNGGGVKNSDEACSDASLLLTKLALARRSADNVSVVVIDLSNNT